MDCECGLKIPDDAANQQGGELCFSFYTNDSLPVKKVGIEPVGSRPAIFNA
jgi:hypothetical protein